MTDDLKRYEPRTLWNNITMHESRSGEWVRLLDVALLRLEVASLRQERDALKAKLADAVKTMNQSRLAFEGYASTRSATDMLDNLLARLRDEGEG